jgi:hypothetical protein
LRYGPQVEEELEVKMLKLRCLESAMEAVSAEATPATAAPKPAQNGHASVEGAHPPALAKQARIRIGVVPIV